MDNRNPNFSPSERPDPWEQDYYQTGSTRPPKNNRGLIAVLLVVIIFLGGIVSALSLLNIRLFRLYRSQRVCFP